MVKAYAYCNRGWRKPREMIIRNLESKTNDAENKKHQFEKNIGISGKNWNTTMNNALVRREITGMSVGMRLVVSTVL